MTRRFVYFFLVAACISVCSPTASRAQAHFTPGVENIRDYAVPEAGVYAVVCNYGYTTSDLTDNNGNKITQVILGPPNGPYLPLNLKVDVKLYALVPPLIWVTHWNFSRGALQCLRRSVFLQQQYFGRPLDCDWTGQESAYLPVRGRRSSRPTGLARLEQKTF